jgi:hypothetical protein
MNIAAFNIQLPQLNPQTTVLTQEKTVSRIEDQAASSFSMTDMKEEAFYLMMPSVAMIIQRWCKIDKISIWSAGGIIESTVHPMTCHKGTRGGVQVQIYLFL